MYRQDLARKQRQDFLSKKETNKAAWNITEVFKTVTTKQIRNSFKKYSLSLAIREMQIKTTLRFHVTPVRMAKIKQNKLITKSEGEMG